MSQRDDLAGVRSSIILSVTMLLALGTVMIYGVSAARLSDPGPVTLRVLDIQGRPVHTLRGRATDARILDLALLKLAKPVIANLATLGDLAE